MGGDGSGEGQWPTNPGDPPGNGGGDNPVTDSILANGNSNGRRQRRRRPSPNGQSTDIQHPDRPSTQDNEGVQPDRVQLPGHGHDEHPRGADPSARIIGWVGRGGLFKIIDQGTSPAGYLWFKVLTRGGKEGWVYSRWVQPAAN